MTDSSGPAYSPAMNDLLSRGHEFSFSQIMRVARKNFGPGGPEEIPGVHWSDRVRVRPDLSLAFPAADVVRVERTGTNGADLLVTTTFLGLYGASSPLPTHYSEDLMDEAAADSSVSRDFLDLLHQRLYQLYFQCWSKYRLGVRLAEEENPQDRERLFCLIGLGERELRDGVPEVGSLLRYAGLFTRPRSASGLQTFLRDALGVRRVKVEQCVLRRVPIPEDQLTRLGVANVCLGVNAVLGSELPDRTGKFRVRLGPLSKAEFDSFLPGTPRHGKLIRLARFYIVDPFDFDLEVVMAAGEARPIRLGDPDGQRLGWNSWCFSGGTLGEVSVIFPVADSEATAPVPVAADANSASESGGDPGLTDYYCQELARLRDLAGNYARVHPELAAMVSGHPADPSVERLFEAVAFMNAQLRLKLDDDFPEIIQEFTEALHPAHLRPTPATTVVAFTPKAELGQPLLIDAGAEIASIPVQGSKCRFRTCFDVTLYPMSLLSASFSQRLGEAPCILLHCELHGHDLSHWQLKTLRFFLGGEHSAACDLYLLLMRHLLRVTVIGQDGEAAVEIPADRLHAAGFAEGEGRLAKEPHLPYGQATLREHFLFPDKFLFLDLCGLEACRKLGHGSRFAIRFELSASLPVAPLVTAQSFVLFATPVVNLFEHKAKPLTFVDDRERQRVEPAGKGADQCSIYSVDRITDFDQDAAEKRSYAIRAHARQSPDILVTHHKTPLGDGYDTFISIAPGSRPTMPAKVKLNVDLTCSNGILPELLKIGDVCSATSTSSEFATFRNITPVTVSLNPSAEQNLHWRLLSGLSLNRTSLVVAGNLRAILRLYLPGDNRDQATADAHLKRIDSLESVDARASDRLIGCSMYRGYEIGIKLRGECFVGPGDLYVFCSVLERFLGGYVTQSCYVRLTAEETGAGYKFEWPARLGDRPLF